MEDVFFPKAVTCEDLMDDFWERLLPGVYSNANKEEEPAK